MCETTTKPSHVLVLCTGRTVCYAASGGGVVWCSLYCAAACCVHYSVAGWYDLMCRETIEDYEKFVSGNEGGSGSGSGAGAGSTHGSVTADVDTDDDDNVQPTAWLTVGPWHHFESMAMGPFGTIVQEACNWMDLTNDHSSGFPPRKPVKLFFMEGHPSQGAWRYVRTPMAIHRLLLCCQRESMLVAPHTALIPSLSHTHNHHCTGSLTTGLLCPRAGTITSMATAL